MLVLSCRDVEAALEIPALVDAVGKAMIDLSADAASMPSRHAATVSAVDGMLASMPAYLPSVQSLTTKLVTLFPRNKDRATHQALICCFDPANGSPIALMDGTCITAMRTAAGSSLATRHLARSSSAVVAVLGTGVQARSHIEVLTAMGQGSTFLVAGRDRRHAEALAEELSDQRTVPVAAAPSIGAALAEADIVCATTSALEPVIRRAALRPGTHVNSVGYNPAGAGEVDADTLRDALVVIESSTALLPPPAGAVEFHRAITAGTFSPEDVHAELGEVISGTKPGRTDEAQITLYKSVGVAVQDAAAAAVVLAAAKWHGIGVDIEI